MRCRPTTALICATMGCWATSSWAGDPAQRGNYRRVERAVRTLVSYGSQGRLDWKPEHALLSLFVQRRGSVFAKGSDAPALLEQLYPPALRKHCAGVARLSGLLAQRCGLSAPTVAAIKTGALLHDLGKLWTPQNVLFKAGRLTRAEKEIIRKHVNIGGQIFKKIIAKPWNDGLIRPSDDFLKIVSQCIATHHERPDGRGYPHKLRDDAIPDPGRILRVGDVFDALRERRPYKSELPAGLVLEHILGNKQTGFDPLVAKALLEELDAQLSRLDGPR
jgi:putative nucleotidyltransferase with HDIG domain